MLAKRISKSFFSLFTGNVISQAIIFYGIIIIANSHTQENFGIFSFALAIATFFIRLTEFGMETIGIRRITQDGNERYVVENIVLSRLILSVFVLSVASIINFIATPSESIKVTFILLFSLIGNALSLEWYYQAQEKMNIVGAIRIIRALFFVVPLICFPLSLLSIEIISWIYSLSFLITFTLFILLYIHQRGFYFAEIKLSKIVAVWKESAPIGIAVTLMQIPYNFGIFIIGIVLTDKEVGIFSAAYRPVVAMWSFGVIAVYHSFFPVLNSFVNDKGALDNFISKLTRILVIAGVVVFLSIASIGKELIDLLYGSKYAGAEYILQLSLIIIFIVLSRVTIEYSLISLKKQKEYLIGMAFVSLLYIPLCTLGAISFRITGVILASILAELIYTGYVLYQMRTFGYWKEYYEFFIKGLTVGTAAYVIGMLPLLTSLPIKLIITYFVLGIGLWTSKLITKNELLLLRKLFNANVPT